jgi:hypothetical protein
MKKLSSYEADAAIIEKARSELYDFANATLLELIKMDKRKSGAFSSINLFCRMDIGVIAKENGELDYFVNEIERGPNAALWTGEHNPHLLAEVAKDLGKLLHGWVEDNTTSNI